jgi:hypothetical protein
MGMSPEQPISRDGKADGCQVLLKEKGLIYTAKHEGWYSVSDEAFYPQSAVQLQIDPPTGRKIMVCLFTQKSPPS